MSDEAYQHDRTLNGHQTVAVNSYDWLQYRDEQDHYENKNPITHASPGVSLNTHNSEIPGDPQSFSPSSRLLANVLPESLRPGQASECNPPVGFLRNAEDKTSGQEDDGSRYEIQYSVFRSLHAYPTKDMAYEQLRRKEEQVERDNFEHLVSDCIEAMETCGRELETVSYTHLDVYKRQFQVRVLAGKNFCHVTLYESVNIDYLVIQKSKSICIKRLFDLYFC